MSEEEVRRAGVLSRVSAGELKQTEAALKLGLSYRQLKRLYKRYRESGTAGLMHRSAGRQSGRSRPEAQRERALGLIREHYGGAVGERFGPTLAAEHLAEEYDLKVDHETLRRWMLAAGLWSRERKRKRYRQRRARKEHFGELLQMDGSFHRWLEERGPRGCLINLVDDATGLGLAWIAEEETTWAVADVLRAWVEQYGIPRAIYTDWKGVYHAPPGQDGEPRAVSQFGMMCARLGIELIAANSPQAKGRVERHHGTHQDRLVKKLRRLGICDYKQANEYLQRSYLPRHNARYGVAPASAVDFHDPVHGRQLDAIFCLEYERVVSEDWVVRFDNRLLQLEAGAVQPGAAVQVQQCRNGDLRLRCKGSEIRWRDVAALPPRFRQAKAKTRVQTAKPALSHPWRTPFLRAQP
jgi:transposase